ncbi:MAG: GMC family oxidoreductase, partial [Gammaproteobacteria bacterium]|nr:GMC family oxidoreductase [Gammaproteobacteria bacterium]
FAKKFQHELTSSDRITVLLRARCTALNTSQDGSRIKSVTLSNGVKQWELQAGNFILSAGGLECTRLLLMTRRSCVPWRRFDSVLGRFYSCHYDMVFGDLYFKSGFPRFNFEKTADGIYARRKLHFSAEYQAKNRLLNSTFRLHFPPYGDASHRSGVLSCIYLAKSIIAGEYQDILNHGQKLSVSAESRWRHLKNVVTDMPSVMRFGYDWLFKMKLARRRLPYTLIANSNGSYPLEFNSEQVPSMDNRIELTSRSDEHGIPRISVHWSLKKEDIQSGINSFLRMQSLLGRTRQTELVFDSGELRERMQEALPIGGHHMGTTRMGESIENSVVDSECRVHGVDNLYVASSSVFPTSGHANPTLTIVALGLRLADHLVSKVEKA